MNENSTDVDPSYVNIGIVSEPSVVEHQDSDQPIESGTPSTTWSEESYTISPYSEAISSTSDTHVKQRSFIDFIKLCKITRGKVIISLIILTILIIIVAIVVIKLAVFNQNYKTYKSTTSKTDSYSDTTTRTKAPIIYEIGDGGASGGPPCSSYTVINDPLRNVATSGIGGKCDNGPFFNTSIGGRWIRFIGAGGTTIPLISPGYNHCGAFLAVWFNGTLPLTTGTIVGANVCFSSYAFTCFDSNSASVINCGNYYVYFLPPVLICNARYCTV